MRSPTTTVARERARPLLGTLVRIRAAGPDTTLDRAFAEIADVHRLMSFQELDSDLGRIGRAEPGAHVALDPRTRECVAAALAWAERSGGAFDPVAAATADASWRDIAMRGDGICVARLLRLDLSGIAKGYAVDRACAALAEAGVSEAVVEAGGDLRVIGDAEEEIALRPSVSAAPALVRLSGGALASSDPALARAQAGRPVHRDGRDRRPVSDRFVAVAAPACSDADALTKIVLAMEDAAAPLLHESGAVAYRHDGRGWSVLGEAR